jgi:hypothetical protein
MPRSGDIARPSLPAPIYTSLAECDLPLPSEYSGSERTPDFVFAGFGNGITLME